MIEVTTTAHRRGEPRLVRKQRVQQSNPATLKRLLSQAAQEYLDVYGPGPELRIDRALTKVAVDLKVG